MSSLCLEQQKQHCYKQQKQSKNQFKYHLALMPLPTQIAGHGSEGDGQRAILKREDGKLLKPVQPPPKGPREAKFYLDINASKGEYSKLFYHCIFTNFSSNSKIFLKMCNWNC